MAIDWDPHKLMLNLRNHRIDFAEVTAVFYDPSALTREDPDAQGEQRLLTIGMDDQGRLLVVVYTLRGDTLRIISARRATTREIRIYQSERG